MSLIQEQACIDEIKHILNTCVVEYPLYLSELIELIHGKFSDDLVKSSCNKLYEAGYIDGIIGLDENYQEFVFAIGGLR